MIFLAEIVAHNGSSAVTLRYATRSFTSRPSDSPAGVSYEGCLQSPGHFSRNLFSPGETNQSVDVGYGSIVLANSDGGLDPLLDYGFDGRSVTIKTMTDEFQALSSASTVFVGTAQSIDSSDMWNQVSLAIHDRRLELDKPLQTVRYAGTTTSGASVVVDEGNEDMKDQIKPLLFGFCRNISLVCVNAYDLIYQAGNNALTTIQVYDKGVPLTQAGSYASAAALKAASITPGKYGVCASRGLIKLGGTPDGQVTADVAQGANAAARTAAQVVKAILTQAGFSSLDYDNATFTALDSLNSAVVGIHITSETHTLEAVQQVLDSVGAWLSPNELGVFQVGRLSAPSGSVATITAKEIIDGIQFVRMNDDGGGIPAYRTICQYRPMWTVMSRADLAGCAANSADWRTMLTTDYREAKAENLAIKTKYLLSPEMKFTTLIDDPTAAATEATRRLGLYSVRRDFIRIRVPREFVSTVKPGQTVKVQVPRFGYNSGRDMVVIGQEYDFGADKITLSLWG